MAGEVHSGPAGGENRSGQSREGWGEENTLRVPERTAASEVQSINFGIGGAEFWDTLGG